jgi:hypothetical protein
VSESTHDHDHPAPVDDRGLGIALFNGTWTLLDKPDRTVEESDAMVHMAHASRHHWGQVGGPAELARGEWLISRVYSVLGRVEPAQYHARRCLELCQRHGIGDWDLGFAYEALARASATAGDGPTAADWVSKAAAVEIAEDEDRALLAADLATIPVGASGGRS